MCKTKLLGGSIIIAVIILNVGIYFYYFDHQPRPNKNSISAPSPAGETGMNLNTSVSPSTEEAETKYDDATGFIIDSGFEEVRANCMGCHSPLLVTQNRATREGWLSTIRWMQETQNFWDLGDNETIILDYLARNYSPPEGIGRRANLKNIQWYPLEK